MLGPRSLRRVARASVAPRHYVALWNSLRVYERPLECLKRYVVGVGDYPYVCRISTPLGPVDLTLYHQDDMQTVNEVFCRLDYAASDDIRTVVDIGSNIGVSALYFLTRNHRSRCHLYEPDPRNLAKLRLNLVGYEDRYSLHEYAVSDREGMVRFRVEPTGRYGAIDAGAVEAIDVRSREINAVLEDVLGAEESIDVLKVDIEGLEERTLRAIRPDLLRQVALVYFEANSRVEPLNDSLFHQSHRGDIAVLKRRA